jgi:hypothetical protein
LGSAFVAAKLYRTKLYRCYPIFFLYLILRIPNSLWQVFVSPKSGLYQKIWIITDPAFVILYVLLVAEVYRLALKNYQGISSLSRWAVYVISAIAVSLSALSLLPKMTPAIPQQTKIMGYIIAIERGANSSLAIFLILLVLFLGLFPIKLNRNVRTHALIYPIFFLSNSILLLMHSLWGMKMASELNTVMLAVSVAAVIGWLILLSPAGEEAPGVISPLSSDYEQRLLSGLERLNATLLKVSRH